MTDTSFPLPSDGLTLADFDYPLDPAQVAQQPVEPRDSARMVVANPDRITAHTTVAALDDHLRSGDLLVVNNTRVMAARLQLTKPTGGAVEVFVLEPADSDGTWYALVKPSRRVADGTILSTDGHDLVEVGPPTGDGRRLVRLDPAALALAGQVPLPPYIHQPLADPERYQTVFADREGSVAAPTAGLHLTTDLLDRLATKGVDTVTVELQVGLGTFRPITTDRVDDHTMHSERYQVAPDTWDRIQGADRVVAVGTTVVRTLESVAQGRPLSGATDLFIRRGHDWKVVDALLTNFHVPKSSLLVLVDAFIGPIWRTVYDQAAAEGYRFLSFGDCQLLERT